MSIHNFTLRATDALGAEALSPQQIELRDADPLWANVKSLLHFDEPVGSTNVLDQKNNSWNRGGSAVITDSVAAFGNSCYLNGSASSFAGTAEAPGTSDFCIEGFILPDADCPDCGLFGFQVASNYDTRCLVRMYPSGGGFAFQASMQTAAGSNFVTSAAQFLSTEELTHFALARQSGFVRLFVNGAQVGSVSSPLNHTSTGMRVGMVYSGSANRYFKGHIDECRYTKDAARYIASFTPPSGPFPDG